MDLALEERVFEGKVAADKIKRALMQTPHCLITKLNSYNNHIRNLHMSLHTEMKPLPTIQVEVGFRSLDCSTTICITLSVEEDTVQSETFPTDICRAPASKHETSSVSN